MTIKVYVSGICGSQEVRKRQQRVLFILQTMPIDLEVIDVTEPGREDDRIFMQEEVKKHDKKILLPPQIFNDNKYCGDYADFQLANDDDDVMRFLKLEEGVSTKTESTKIITENGVKDSSKDDNAHENTGEVIDTTGENLNVPENQNIMDNNVNVDDSDVEMQNIASHQEVHSNVVEENKKIISLTEEKAMSSEESAEEESK